MTMFKPNPLSLPALRKRVWFACLFFILINGVSSCKTGCPTCKYTPCIPPVVPVNLRRPPVIVYNEPVVINFCDDTDEEDEEDEKKKENIDFHDMGTHSPYKPMVDEYYLGLGDLIDIYITGDPEASRSQVVVAPDGKIYFYLLEGIYVDGLTLNQAKKKIEEKLTDYYLSPDVTIIPRNLSNLNFAILGRVNIPGLYPLIKSTSIRQALGMAGGLLSEDLYFGAGAGFSGDNFGGGSGYYGLSAGNYRNLKNSFIIRDGKRLPIDFEKLVLKGDFSQDIFLKPGDYIYISSKQDLDVYVLGNVTFPQAIKFRENLTLIGAIANATGFIMGGPYGPDLHRCIVIRGDLKSPEVIEADIKLIITGRASDFYLKPGDIVFLANKRFRFGRELVQLALYTFIESFGNAAGSYYGDRIFGIEGEVPITPVITSP